MIFQRKQEAVEQRQRLIELGLDPEIDENEEIGPVDDDDVLDSAHQPGDSVPPTRIHEVNK